MSWSLRLVLWYLAALMSFNVCVGTGLITGWGCWYAPNVRYRQQTEAMYSGRLALASSPTAVEDDLVWAEGGVHQVWGLGVPCWRMPFEILAKVFGQRGFPDRGALAIAILLVSYFVLRVFTVPDGVRQLDDWLSALLHSPLAAAAALLLLFFPPVINLCGGPFKVYEEAVVYGYYYAVGLFAATSAFAKRPTIGVYLVLSLFAGLAAFVRPTVGAYGIATVVIAAVLARRAGWNWRQSLSGPALFGVGSALLFWTNLMRFGSGLEFGHQLTRTSLDLMYLLRFPTPINEEPILPAARELFGWLFFAKDFEALYSWQLPTRRWRELYHTTFDWTYVASIMIFWPCAAWSIRRRREITPPVSRTRVLATAAWSIISLSALFVFYLRLPAISSRYMLDFAPGICVTFVGWLQLLEGLSIKAAPRNSRFLNAGSIAALSFWWIYQIAVAQHHSPPTLTLTQREVVVQMQQGAPELRSIPAHYDLAMNLVEMTGIPHNGAGWAPPDGHVEEIVVLFVTDPSRLRIEVAPAKNASPTEEQYASIRAKIGLEFLELKSVKPTERGRMLTFAKPNRKAYRHGIQVVFLDFLPPQELVDGISPFCLLHVDWTD